MGITLREATSALASHLAIESRVEDVRDLEILEAKLGQKLPADFKHFQMFLGAGCTLGPVPYLRFYPAEELPSRQESVPPEVLEFATDDSTGYAFDLTRNRSSATYPIVSYPLSSRDRAEIEFEAHEFREFLERLLLRLAPLRPLS